jgi:chorismate mutase
MAGPDASRLELERRFEQLCAQVRQYPTPIARCDEQLSALIEERAHILEELSKHAS